MACWGVSNRLQCYQLKAQDSFTTLHHLRFCPGIRSSTIAVMMLSRWSISRNLIKSLQRQSCGRGIQKRGLAAAASGSFQYETGEELGIKYASRNLPGPTTTLTLVAKAGTRYQTYPGYSDALEKFAFKVCQASCYSNGECP